MDKNQESAVENFLNGSEEQSVSFEQPVSPFEESFEQGRREEVEEKAIPFHKDPKVQKFINKEIEKRLRENAVYEPQERNEEVKDDYYERLIGNDTPEKVAMIREALERDERLLLQAEERAFNRLSQIEQEEVQADREAEDELSEAFDFIEENYGVDISSNGTQARKTREEFISFVEKIAPKNSDGEVIDYPDMQSAWETYSEIKKSNTVPSRAKELANRSMARSTENTVRTPERVDWNKVEEYMDSLK